MPRVTNSTRRHSRRKKILNNAKGYRGRRSKLFRTAKDAVVKAESYSYRDRKKRKRDFRRLWIARISAACRSQDITYSRFINGLNKANISINRKVLSNMAIEDCKAFNVLVEKSKESLGV